jgi:hypothetical protein
MTGTTTNRQQLEILSELLYGTKLRRGMEARRKGESFSKHGIDKAHAKIYRNYAKGKVRILHFYNSRAVR